MRGLSPWKRLWIVGAIIMWSAGAWQLYEHPPSRVHEPLPCEFDGLFFTDERPDGELEVAFRECVGAHERHYRANKEAIDAVWAARERDFQLRLWTRIGLIALAPFAAGAALWIMLIAGRWIWRGRQRAGV
jgi:hypothetical protein